MLLTIGLCALYHLSIIAYNNFDLSIVATKGNTLKEEWIAYICREILRVSIFNFFFVSYFFFTVINL